jgi:hypothetical protein
VILHTTLPAHNPPISPTHTPPIFPTHTEAMFPTHIYQTTAMVRKRIQNIDPSLDENHDEENNKNGEFFFFSFFHFLTH